MIAYVVSIKGAARPDKDGLLQPLLKRWQAGGCSYSVFALPAVQVGAVLRVRMTKGEATQHGVVVQVLVGRRTFGLTPSYPTCLHAC